MNKLPKWYLEERKSLLPFFEPQYLIKEEPTKYSSQGDYRLAMIKYHDDDGNRLARGIVTHGKTLIADIKRNHDSFWYAWAKQQGKENLLCGEDVQGYSVVDLQDRKTFTYIDPNALEGLGFRWLDAMPSPNGNYLLVEGCYFACPKITAIFDFTKPTKLPLQKMAILDNKFMSWYDVRGWIDNNTVAVEHEKEIKCFDVCENKLVACR